MTEAAAAAVAVSNQTVSSQQSAVLPVEYDNNTVI